MVLDSLYKQDIKWFGCSLCEKDSMYAIAYVNYKIIYVLLSYEHFLILDHLIQSPFLGVF
jgi:hypothetical protein